ncbi:hypothetical protein [Croceicoccus sp. Ery5]|uniref:hypothetical protein n=1 Tax=Croceicoccus sp. Ery5 TaxID=1703340 RepID=UPI001E46FB02|nr:hypothetical protein [Croceicoccus sp. Ery5]
MLSPAFCVALRQDRQKIAALHNLTVNPRFGRGEPSACRQKTAHFSRLIQKRSVSAVLHESTGFISDFLPVHPCRFALHSLRN